MSEFVVVGNPIEHSLSPFIHKQFAKQTGIVHNYSAKLVNKHNLVFFLNDFFSKSGKGVNITLPFKKEAFLFADQVTNRANIAGSVNTLIKLSNKIILGDNTDGEGLLYDLRKLNFLKKKDNVLLLGAGGVAYGIMNVLLDLNCSIFVFNRTFSNAEKLVLHFNKYKKITILKQYELINFSFDLIINATSSGVTGDIPMISSKVINNTRYCYDMYYTQKREQTPFLSWCLKNGARDVQDGMGMLVAQAAASFFLWHRIRPEIEPVINILRNTIHSE
ncbi:shikimate dehydrogenase [Buchnera aphidicola]|uniref:shikimate dehydrogenase n=1 Tax=Buchnera aphidicola TaxID=9 RepID=UPI003464044A